MLLPIIIYTVPLIILLTLLKNYLLLPGSIPGPLLARFTNLYRAYLVYRRSPHEEHLSLHKTHGPIVRLGPNTVSISGSPKYIPQIYGIGKGLVKSDFYSCFQNVVNGRRAASLVAMTDEAEHARSKRLIANAYSLSTLVEYEGLVDRTVKVFLQTLERRFCGRGTGDAPVSDEVIDTIDRGSDGVSSKSHWSQPLDLGDYLQFFAFDVIGELTFSRRLGFIESGTDVDGIMGAIGANFEYFSVLGQIPWLDEAVLGKNPLYVRYFRKAVSSPILLFAQRLLKERLKDADLDNDEMDKQEDSLGKGKKRTFDHPDFLSRFLKIRHEQSLAKSSPSPTTTPETEAAMTDSTILSNLFMNINAGSDTIASTLRAIFYHLLKNPQTLATLQAELDHATKNNTITSPCPTWTQTQLHLPYLCAVVKEGLRMNPALSLPLERVVPPSGMPLTHDDGTTTVLPAGTIIGINPWVQQRHKPTFGEDAESWNPSRWLSEQEKATKGMEHAMLAFGAGKRSCLGKNIALLELHKVVAALVGRFEIELVDQSREWTVRNAWALNQSGLEVRTRVR